MNNIHLSIILISILALIPTATFVKATNEGSYIYGKWQGSETGPQNNATLNEYPTFDNNTCGIHPSSTLTNGVVIPSVTNTTACEHGFFNGYKEWCTNHAVDCVQNITSGQFPEMIIQAKEQYNAGAKAANDSGNTMCPIGNNAAFCQGWDSQNDDYGGQDCADTPLANITTDLVGCIGDTIPASQIGGLPMLVGKWHFVNESSTRALELGITGTFLFNNNGYMKMTVPSNTGFGDYTLESSWAYIGTKHHILTFCYAGGCENQTLTLINPNHIEFVDNNNDTIYLTPFHHASTTPALSQETKEMLRNRDNVTTIYHNGLYAADLHNYTGALTLYQKALRINPLDVGVLADMGRILYDLQNYTGAIQSLNKALSIDPTSVYALEQKGFILNEIGHHNEALVYFNRALSLPNPFLYDTLNNKGVALLKLGDYGAALSTFDEIIKANPYNSLAFYNKALAALHLGLEKHDIRDINLALQNVEKALSITPDDKSAIGLRTSLGDLLAWNHVQG
jgi:lipoprotein NlpI